MLDFASEAIAAGFAPAVSSELGGLSVPEARAALNGLNYVMQTDAEGKVDSVIVSGESGSGKGNPLAAEGSLPSADHLRRGEMPPRPVVRLKEKMQGQAAVEALGADLPAVAAEHGWAPERLKEILLTDSTAWIDIHGRVFFAETPQMGVPGEQGAGTVAPATGPAAADLGKTFTLHSKRGSKRVIYLDFNGHTVTGSVWNSAFAKPVIAAPAFDLGGNAAVFDGDELARIQNIWKRVSEDYAPFDVDVTTEEPTAAALERSSDSDQTYGTRAVITKAVLDCACGGLSHVGVFDYPGSAFKPVWIFYDMLGGGNEKFVAEAITHELGHNFGLAHDGTASAGYYEGHGAGATGWAPIMGIGYYRELSQWNPGDYPGANNQEDDLGVLQTHGAALLPDDGGDNRGNARPLRGRTVRNVFKVSQSGRIQRRSDVDYYVFVTSGGPVNLKVSAAALGANLDISAALYSGAHGVPIVSSNPAAGLDAEINANLAAGTYYLKIDGVGKAPSGSDAGYSDYGSLGRYQISGSYGKGVAQAPVAVASPSAAGGVAPLAVGFSSAGSRDDSMIVSYRWNFGDGTPASTERNPSHTFAVPGNYLVKLTVTDDSGLTATAITRMTVTSARTRASVRVGRMAMLLRGNGRMSQSFAYVLVLDGDGKPVPYATVQGKWGSLVAATGSALSNASGVAIFASPLASAIKGTFTFTVSGITRTGYTYAPAKNASSVSSITR